MTHQQALDGLASERYLLDEMTEVERFEFEEHYFDCAECAEDVRLGDMIRQEARRAGVAMAPNTQVGRPAVVLTSAKWWRRPMVAAPWAVAATLALVVGYQSLVTVPGLRDAGGPQSIEPVMLRGATRGAAHARRHRTRSALRCVVGGPADAAAIVVADVRDSRCESIGRCIRQVFSACLRGAVDAARSRG